MRGISGALFRDSSQQLQSQLGKADNDHWQRLNSRQRFGRKSNGSSSSSEMIDLLLARSSPAQSSPNRQETTRINHRFGATAERGEEKEKKKSEKNWPNLSSERFSEKSKLPSLQLRLIKGKETRGKGKGKRKERVALAV